MCNNRPSKRMRERMATLGHLHSPPTNSKAIRKANIQSLLTKEGRAATVWKSDTPAVIALAAAKSPYVKAYAPTRGQGQGKPKPKVTPKDKTKFRGDVPYVLDGELVNMADERAKAISPERKYRQENTKKGKKRYGFRKFNSTGKA